MNISVVFPKLNLTNFKILEADKMIKVGKAGTWDCIPEKSQIREQIRLFEKDGEKISKLLGGD